jgi:hypothetical protein
MRESERIIGQIYIPFHTLKQNVTPIFLYKLNSNEKLQVVYLKNSIFAPLSGLLMEYREIVAVTGLGGLYQLVTTKSDGAIVRNVADKSTRFISARQHNVTPLDSIEVYTMGENVRLQHVFQKMQEHEASIPLADAKSTDNRVIKGYFKSIFPEFDEDRVYVSDMKKMLRWYELLKANDLLKFETEEEGASEEIPAENGTEIIEEPANAEKETAETTTLPAGEDGAETAESEESAETEDEPEAANEKNAGSEESADSE